MELKEKLITHSPWAPSTSFFFEPVLAFFSHQASIINFIIISFSQKFYVSIVSGKQNKVLSKVIFSAASGEQCQSQLPFTGKGGHGRKAVKQDLVFFRLEMPAGRQPFNASTDLVTIL